MDGANPCPHVQALLKRNSKYLYLRSFLLSQCPVDAAYQYTGTIYH